MKCYTKYTISIYWYLYTFIFKKALGVKKSEVSLIGGMKSREKVIRVETSDIDGIEKRLKSLVN